MPNTAIFLCKGKTNAVAPKSEKKIPIIKHATNPFIRVDHSKVDI